MPFVNPCCSCDPCRRRRSRCGCGCDDKHDDCDCDKHRKHDEDSAYLKFSGILPGSEEGTQTFYLGDAGPVPLNSNVPISYPVARRGRLKNLAVNVAPPLLVPVNGLISVQLFKNGAAVAGFLVTWLPGETTGLKSVKTDDLKISRDDLIELRVSVANISLDLTITATIGVKT